MEDLVFHASRQETHWSLLESCPRRVASDCLCGHSDETLEHLFFHCLLAQSGLDWIQSLLFLFSPLAPAITVRHVLFGFSSDELLCVPRVFCYLLSLLKFFVWCQRGMNIVFGPNLQVPWVWSLATRVACPSISPCFLNVFGLGGGAVFSNAIGELMAVSVRSLVTLFISVFLNVVRVCLPRSPLLAVLWSLWLWVFCLSVCVFPLFALLRSPSLAVLRFSWALSWLCLSMGVSPLAALLCLWWLHCGLFSWDRFR